MEESDMSESDNLTEILTLENAALKKDLEAEKAAHYETRRQLQLLEGTRRAELSSNQALIENLQEQIAELKRNEELLIDENLVLKIENLSTTSSDLPASGNIASGYSNADPGIQTGATNAPMTSQPDSETSQSDTYFPLTVTVPGANSNVPAGTLGNATDRRIDRPLLQIEDLGGPLTPDDAEPWNHLSQSVLDELCCLAEREEMKLKNPPRFRQPHDNQVRSVIKYWYKGERLRKPLTCNGIVVDENSVRSMRPYECVSGNFISLFLHALCKLFKDCAFLDFEFFHSFSSSTKDGKFEHVLEFLLGHLYETTLFRTKKWIFGVMDGNQYIPGPVSHLLVLATDTVNMKIYFIDPNGREDAFPCVNAWKFYLKMRKELLRFKYSVEYDNELDGTMLSYQQSCHAVQADFQNECVPIGLMNIMLLLRNQPMADFKIENVNYGRLYLTNFLINVLSHFCDKKV